MLIGSYFTQEYALESAALFNPSMVWHPDQSGLADGSRRFILSLRATGEGHISSITFRSGTIDAENRIRMDEPTRFVTAPELVPNTLYDKTLVLPQADSSWASTARSPARSWARSATSSRSTSCERAISRAVQQSRPRQHEIEPVAQGMLTLAKANYEIRYSPEQHVSERIIFPFSPTETNGIEDARFVQFHDDDGSVRYYATYTAFDGKVILPQILETDDFLHFKVSTLNGPEVRNKGFALFPRKVNGLYAMLSRQDNENIYLMYSDMLHFWYTKELIAKPTYAWEFVQLGNCGSPIETEAGWLVLTHGVGPMRKYAMGAFLLDLDDPSRVIGRLDVPLLEPDANEREGYVPNVVYSCGGRHPQPRADHPLRHVRLRQHVRHRLARRGAWRRWCGSLSGVGAIPRRTVLHRTGTIPTVLALRFASSSVFPDRLMTRGIREGGPDAAPGIVPQLLATAGPAPDGSRAPG